MKLRIIISLLLWPELVLAAGPACTEPELQKHVDRAEHFVWRFADVPAPNTPRSWLEAIVNGKQLVLYSSNHAILSDLSGEWEIDIRCSSESGECEAHAAGDVPSDAGTTADAIQDCMSGKSPMVEAEMPADDGDVATGPALNKSVEPTAFPAQTEDAKAALAGAFAPETVDIEAIEVAVNAQPVVAPPEVCDPPLYADMNASFALQALLIDLGATIDFDGIVGPKTRTAVAKYLPAENLPKTPSELLTDLQNRTCRHADGSVTEKTPEQQNG